jgi:hypothetical protein
VLYLPYVSRIGEIAVEVSDIMDQFKDETE